MDLISIVDFIAYWSLAIIATERITEIIVASVLFAPLREKIAKLAFPINSPPLPIYTWLNKLITCGFCTSTWIAFGLQWFLPGDYLWVCKSFGLMGLANLYHIIYEWLRRGRASYKDHTISLNPEIVTILDRWQ